MIEQIPNPLKDQGVKNDIEEKVKSLMNTAGGHLNIVEEMEYLIRKAAQWGMLTGFNMGWRISENRTVKRMREQDLLLKQTKGEQDEK